MAKADDKISSDILMLEEDQTPRIEANLKKSNAKKLHIVCSSILYIPNLNKESCHDSEGEGEETTLVMTGLKVEDANGCESKLLNDLMVEIFARGSCIEYWKLQFLNKQFSELLKSGEIFRVRQKRGLVKPYVLIRTSSGNCWTMFDQDFKNFQKIQEIPSKIFTIYSEKKETICAGTQLIVVGSETESDVVWRYELEMCKWFKGPEMITPRRMFGSASRGTDAFFAGGIKMSKDWISEVVNVAEKYNADTKTWTSIPAMHKRRKFSAGCFFREKFYVIGGRDENNQYLTCGESFDEVKNSWELIPDMIKGMSNLFSPPLIAVVKDNLYMLATASDELHVYDVTKNTWKPLGVVPVRALRGYGVVFKSMGDRLLLIGGLKLIVGKSQKMSVFTWYPSENTKEIIWEKFDNFSRPDVYFDHFIRNCCVMFA